MGTGWLATFRSEGRQTRIAALGALCVATFCLAITENLPSALLPQISSSFGTSLSVTGQLVTGYGLTVAITTVPLTYAANRIPRRALLSGLMTVFVLASLGSAIAPNYGLMLVSRALTALVHAVFWAVVTVTAMGLFPLSVRGRVLAIVYGAGSIATILGIPAATWLGQRAGWRMSFVALSGIGLLALLTIVIFLPPAVAREAHTSKSATPDHRRYVVLLVTMVLAITGLSMAFTYTVPFLTDVSGFSVQAISPLLLLRGAAGATSLAAAGSLADRHPRLATTAPTALLCVAFTGMYVVGREPLIAALLVALSGISYATLTTTLTSELLTIAPGNLDIASAGGNAVFNTGIAAGALLGGLILPRFGVRSVALAGGLMAAAALTVLLADQLIGRPPPGPAPAIGAKRLQQPDAHRHG